MYDFGVLAEETTGCQDLSDEALWNTGGAARIGSSIRCPNLRVTCDSLTAYFCLNILINRNVWVDNDNVHELYVKDIYSIIPSSYYYFDHILFIHDHRNGRSNTSKTHGLFRWTGRDFPLTKSSPVDVNG